VFSAIVDFRSWRKAKSKRSEGCWHQNPGRSGGLSGGNAEVGSVWPAAKDVKLVSVDAGGVAGEWSSVPGSDASRVLRA